MDQSRSDGHQRVKGKEADQNPPGRRLLRQNSSLRTLTRGKLHGLLWTDGNGGNLFIAYVPLDIQRTDDDDDISREVSHFKA